MLTISFKRQPAIALELLLQRFAGDQLHHQERQILALVVLDLMDGDDVFVADRSRRPGFPAKSLGGNLILGEFGIENLDGDVALQAGVHGLKDDAHAAAADHPHDVERAERAQMAAVFRRIEEGERHPG